MNRDEAEKLSVLLLQIVAKLDESAAFVRDKDTKEDWDKYRQAVGKAMGEICVELEEPLWKRFPGLKPEALGGPYKIDPAIYEPKFYSGEDEATYSNNSFEYARLAGGPDARKQRAAQFDRYVARQA